MLAWRDGRRRFDATRGVPGRLALTGKSIPDYCTWEQLKAEKPERTDPFPKQNIAHFIGEPAADRADEPGMAAGS